MKARTAGNSLKSRTDHAAAGHKKQDSDAHVVAAEARTPMALDEALLDFGRSIVNSSITQSIEFHKTMLGITATFATLMASSFGILAVGMKDNQLDTLHRALFVVPILLMLVSSVCFALGYYPRYIELRLQVLDSIRVARNNLIRVRRIWAILGVSFFILSVIALLVSIVVF